MDFDSICLTEFDNNLVIIVFVKSTLSKYVNFSIGNDPKPDNLSWALNFLEKLKICFYVEKLGLTHFSPVLLELTLKIKNFERTYIDRFEINIKLFPLPLKSSWESVQWVVYLMKVSSYLY